MRLIALLATFNEERFIAACLEHLIQQGAEVFLIDNESTDRTVAIASEFRGRGLIDIQTMPREGEFDLSAILANKERLAATLEADWFLHVDADEFHMAPRAGQSLAEALAEVDARGENVVNFIEFCFVPTQEAPDHDHPDFQRTMHWYYLHQPDYPFLMRAWKKQSSRVGLAATGGHKLQFPGLRLHPQPFFMRHYLCLSADSAARKYVGRQFPPEELRLGWHGWRAHVASEAIRLPKQLDLTRYNDDGQFDFSRPRCEDFLANTAEWSAEGHRTVICAAGMHCSGTSLVAGLLAQCGLYLSPEEQLLPTERMNQDSIWERTSFLAINEGILRQMGSGWDAPLLLDDGWDLQLPLMPLRVRAIRFIQQFAEHVQWGWEDPRSSLTWGFWKRLIPELKLIICVRNPLEVAQSLSQRGYSSTNFGLSLWLDYNQRILAEVPPEDRVVTHYASFFCNAEAEIRRLVSLLHLRPSEADVQRAISTISTSLRPNGADEGDLSRPGLPDNVLQVYAALCAEAGPVCKPLLDAELEVFAQPPEHAPTRARPDLAATVQWSCLAARLDAANEQLAMQHVQSHAALADFTAQLSAERLKSEAAKAALSAQLDAERSQAEAAQAALDAQLGAERSQAEAAQAALGAQLDAERSQAEAAQAALDAQLDAERSQAEAAQAALTAQLTRKEQALDLALAEASVLRESTQQVVELTRSLQVASKQLDTADNVGQAYLGQLEAIHKAKFWRVMTAYWKAREAVVNLFPRRRHEPADSIPDETRRA